jgi:hypothetical protein
MDYQFRRRGSMERSMAAGEIAKVCLEVRACLYTASPKEFTRDLSRVANP